MQLRTKIILLGVLPLVASLLLIALTVRHQERSLARSEHTLVEREYMHARRSELRHYVELAVSTVAPLYNQDSTKAAADTATDAARKQQALQQLSSLNYGTDGYFFVYDLQGTVLMHSRQPELVGRNLWNLQDAQGRFTIRELIQRARSGGGFVDYQWNKPSSAQTAPKLGYVVELSRWQWMLGTGLYLDDIHTTMAQLDSSASANIATTLLWITGIAVFGVGLISGTALLLNLSEHRVADTKLLLLARQVVQSQEDERAHLSRELHDGVSQTLVSTKLLVESAVETLQSLPPDEATTQAAMRATAPLNLALGRLNASLTEVRRISHRLRPALLDNLGLPAALQHLGHEFNECNESRPPLVQVLIDGTPHDLPEVVNTVLFRVAQECLTNISKHARAAQVEVALEFEPPKSSPRSDPGSITLRVTDDGCGFDSTAVQQHPERGIGLRNMRERLESIGGTITLQSAPGHGTQLEAKVPGAALNRLSQQPKIPHGTPHETPHKT